MRMILEKALIALLNQEKDKADSLFHDFILERSRQIHESLRQGEDFVLNEGMDGIMSIDEMFGDDDLVDDEPGMGQDDQVTDGEVTSDDVITADGDDEVASVDGDEEEVEEPIEDRVSDLESDVQRLAAEFDALMGGKTDDDADEDDLEEDDQSDEGDDTVEESTVQVTTTSDGNINVVASNDDDEEEEDDGLGMSAYADTGDDLHHDSDFSQDFDDLSESIVDELERITTPTGDGREQGNGRFKQNTTSPALNTAPEKRQAGKPVKISSTEHSGYDRETAPTSKKIATRSNVKASATDGQSAVKKEGNSAAVLNKLTADPAGQKSLLGSKK